MNSRPPRSTRQRSRRRAVADADNLIQSAMKSREYPVAHEFDESAADPFVDHFGVIELSRAVYDVAGRPETMRRPKICAWPSSTTALVEHLLGYQITGTGARG